jgi:hypothetical protein
VPECGLSGAEVVERRPHRDRPQADEHVDRPIDVRHHDVLGDLELEVLGAEAAIVKQPFDLRGEAEVEQVARPEVHRGAEVEPVAAQAANLLDHAVEHERGQGLGQAAVLHQRQEVVGSQQAALGVLPAHQRLDPADRPGRQVRLGLVVQHELAGVQRAVELPDQHQSLAAVAIARGQVHLVASPPALRFVHRNIGALQQPQRVGRMLGEQRDADTWRRCAA